MVEWDRRIVAETPLELDLVTKPTARLAMESKEIGEGHVEVTELGGVLAADAPAVAQKLGDFRHHLDVATRADPHDGFHQFRVCKFAQLSGRLTARLSECEGVGIEVVERPTEEGHLQINEGEAGDQAFGCSASYALESCFPEFLGQFFQIGRDSQG